MNGWILSVIICSASPMPDGSYCSAVPLAYGLSREICQAELERWRQHKSKPQLECIDDPALSAELEELNGNEEPAVSDAALNGA